MEPDKINENTKQSYEKPRLRIIELAAEEVLGVGCKTRPDDTTGSNGAAGCVAGPCSNVIAS